MATSSVPKGKYLNEEYLAICAKLDSDEWVDISTLAPIIADIRVKYNVQETKKSLDNFEEMELNDQIKYLKDQRIKQLLKDLKLAKDAGLIDEHKSIEHPKGTNMYKGYKGLLDDYMLRLRNEWISKEGIEIVRGNLNFSILSQIQGWVTDRMDQEEEVPSYIISIEDSLYDNHSSDKGTLTLEQKHLSRLSYSIIYKKAVKITYLPNALGGKQLDELTFSPEYLRRVGRKWMVYGMSKSARFTNDENTGLYVNLVVARIKTIKDSKEPYQESGVDYSDDPFKDQMTYHSFPLVKKGERRKLQEVVLKVRKQKDGYVKNSYIYPFERIKQEPLHYSQRVIEEKEYADYGISKEDGYGYIVLNVTDAPYIRPLLMTWGADLEVMSPPELRKSMADEIEAMQVMYGRPLKQ